MSKLQQEYTDIFNKYAKAFCDKYGFLDYDCVHENEVIHVSDYYFCYTDIREAVDNDIDQKIIFSWYETIDNDSQAPVPSLKSFAEMVSVSLVK